MSSHRLQEMFSRVLGRRAAIGALGLAGATALPSTAAARQEADCTCQQFGVTGGGIVRTESGDANLVMFASRLVDSDVPPTGVVRWNDPNFESGLKLENDGAIVYGPVEGQPLSREVSGWAKVNGERLEPFRLLVTVSDEVVGTPGSCIIAAGDSLGAGGSGWAYSASGDLVGGDLMLIGKPPATT